MGSSFVAYGIVMLLMLRVGGPLLIRNGKSQEWYDSWVIMAWGIVNTFTEHRYDSAKREDASTHAIKLTLHYQMGTRLEPW